ncbi:MAG: hypothetical protein ACLTR8_04355 [Oscillospiraceae bacterium]
MRHEIFHLKDFYRELGKNGCDATLTTYLPDNLPEMGRIDERRPCLLICPGGGYEFCSKREQEPIALYFLPNGFECFYPEIFCCAQSISNAAQGSCRGNGTHL